MTDLLGPSELPAGFTYPPQLVRMVEHELTDLHPWWILTGEHLHTRQRGVRGRYPDRELVVLAKREDNDDVACLDLQTTPHPVVVIHDFAEPGWEQRASFPGIAEWLRSAFDDFLTFEE